MSEADFSEVPSPNQNGHDPHIWTRQQVWAIRYAREFNADQKRRILHNFICSYENRKTSRGAFIRTNEKRAYLFDGHRCKLYCIDPNDLEFRGYLWDVYGLNANETMTRHVISSLQSAAIAQGLVREVRRFTYFDRNENTLYISAYDGNCYKLTGDDDPVIVPNGHGPAIFIDDDGGEPLREITCGNNGRLFQKLVGDLQYAPTTAGGMAPEAQKTCLSIWLFILALGDLMPTKPLLLVEGDRGSGKTLALQRISLALHGKYMPLSVPQKEDADFGIKILRSPIAIIDDVNEPVKWLRDALCTYLTGGGWTRRKLYSDTDEVVIRPQSFLAITTNNPTTFRQDQVADRSLIIRLERRQDQNNYMPAGHLFEEIRLWREELFGEWLWWLNEIVAALRRRPSVAPTKYRMADFAHLAYTIARVLENPSDGRSPPGDWSRRAIDEMLESMENERGALVIEGDPLIDLIDRWLEKSSNQGREVRIGELYQELGAIARQMGVEFYRTPKSLAGRIRSAGGSLSHYFQITRRTTHNGTLIYTFRHV